MFRANRLFRLAELGATEMELTDRAGWSDPRPARFYIKLLRQLNMLPKMSQKCLETVSWTGLGRTSASREIGLLNRFRTLALDE